MTQTTYQPQSAEPATLSYFYGPGISDITSVVTNVLTGVRDFMDTLSDKTRDSMAKISSTSSGMSSVVLCYAYGISAVALRYVYWLGVGTMQLLASVACCLFMLLPQIIVFGVVEVAGVAFTTIIKCIDIVYLKLRRVSQVCDRCHERFTLPVYLCPRCGKAHRNLMPNRYGALHHRCECGERLGSSVLAFSSLRRSLQRRRKPWQKPSVVWALLTLTFGHPRRSLQAICPNCLKSGRIERVQGSGSRSILIPVVGGESAGKTALITAYTHRLIESRLPKHGLESEFYSDEKKNMFGIMQQNYRQGTVQKTATVTVDEASSVFSLSFYIRGGKLKPQRLIQIYDIAGETFVTNQEHEQQRQYDHCDGIVLVIDPMSLPNAEALWGSQLASGDRSTISSARLEDVMSALNNNLRETTRLDRSGKLDTPLAVVLGKIDEAKGLIDRVGPGAVARLRRLNPELWANDDDAMDFLCRQFLVDMDMPEIVDLVAQNFKTSRFFAVSAIGHTAGDGSSFEPWNVDKVMDWIVSRSDPDLAREMHVQAFSNAVLPLREPAVGLFDQLMGQQR